MHLRRAFQHEAHPFLLQLKPLTPCLSPNRYRAQITNFSHSISGISMPWVFSSVCARQGGRREGISISESHSLSCKKMKFFFLARMNFHQFPQLEVHHFPEEFGHFPSVQSLCGLAPAGFHFHKISLQIRNTAYCLNTVRAQPMPPDQGLVSWHFTSPICWLLA